MGKKKEEHTEHSTQWYTNKRLYEMIFGKDGLRDDIIALRQDIKQYNGLREDLDETIGKLDEQIEFCSKRMNAEQTEAEVMARIGTEKEKVFFKVLKLVAVLFTVLGTAVALMGLIFW